MREPTPLNYLAANRESGMARLLQFKFLGSLLLIGLLLPTKVFAQGSTLLTVKELRESCLAVKALELDKSLIKSGEDHLKLGLCIGFMQSEFAARVMFCGSKQNPGRNRFGADAKIMGRQLAEVSVLQMAHSFLNFADANPELWSKPVLVVSSSFFLEWPCDN